MLGGATVIVTVRARRPFNALGSPVSSLRSYSTYKEEPVEPAVVSTRAEALVASVGCRDEAHDEDEDEEEDKVDDDDDDVV